MVVLYMRACEEERLLQLESQSDSNPGMKECVTITFMTLFGLGVGCAFVAVKHFLGINAI